MRTRVDYSAVYDDDPECEIRLELSTAVVDRHGERLQAAQAEFQSAWQDKQACKARQVFLIREKAEKVKDTAAMSRGAALVVYLMLSTLMLMLGGLAIQEHLRLLLVGGLIGCGAFYFLARGVAALLHRIADWLEAKEIQYV